MRKLLIGIVLVVLLSPLAFAAFNGYTSETRYAVSPGPTLERDIVFSANRYYQGYIKPFGGFGAKGASGGSRGAKGVEEGSLNLPSNAFIPNGRNPAKISNPYASFQGYQNINQYIDLVKPDNSLITRPQINGSPQGYARIVNYRRQQVGLLDTAIQLRTRDLPLIAPYFTYGVWLVDEDTGYTMLLGNLQPQAIGRTADFKFNSIPNSYGGSYPLVPFDTMMVTIQPYPDNDQLPGPVVLTGDMRGNKVVVS
jgi:hypothetical protein